MTRVAEISPTDASDHHTVLMWWNVVDERHAGRKAAPRKPAEKRLRRIGDRLPILPMLGVDHHLPGGLRIHPHTANESSPATFASTSVRSAA